MRKYTKLVYYSQSTPELFFDTQEKVYQRMGRPFTHWHGVWPTTRRTPIFSFFRK